MHLRVPDALSRREHHSSTAEDNSDDFLQGFDVIESKPDDINDEQSSDAKEQKYNRTPNRPPPGIVPNSAAAISTDVGHQINREVLIKEQRNDANLKLILDYLLHGLVSSHG